MRSASLILPEKGKEVSPYKNHMISTRTLFPAARNEKELSLFVSSIKLKRNFSADIILSTAEKHELLVSCRSLELEIGVS